MNLSDISTDDPMSFEALKLFDCTIHVLDQGVAYPIVLSVEEDYAESIVPGRWDWLIKGDPGQAYEDGRRIFKFHFRSRDNERLHYLISGTSSRYGRRLACSHKGYVGMYTAADAINIFKLQPLAWDGQQLRCRWRDHLGQTVEIGEYPGDPRSSDRKGGYLDHLNVNITGPTEFLITPIG